MGVVAQLARASDLHSEGRGFKPHPVHKWFTKVVPSPKTTSQARVAHLVRAFG